MSKVVGRLLFEDTVERDDTIRSASYVPGRKGVVRMEVVLQDCEVLNRNRRLYHKRDVEQALASDYVKEKLSTSSFLGEMNHPQVDPKNPMRQLQIDLNNVSHVIKDVYWDKNEPNVLLGIVETAGTRVGRDFAGLIMENGMQCSFSMRGSGDVIDRGSYREVKGPIKIITYDAVAFPSHQRAYVRRMINEDTTQIDITQDMIVRELAHKSRNNDIMLNEFVELTENMVDYTYSEGGIIISDKDTKKPLAFTNLETSLREDYKRFMASI